MFIISEDDNAQALVARFDASAGAGLHPRDRPLPFAAALTTAQLKRCGICADYVEFSPSSPPSAQELRLLRNPPDIALFEINYSQIRSYRRLAGLAGIKPEHLIAFGTHAATDPSSLLKEGFDYCITGEPEIVASNLAEWLISGKSGPAPAGLAWTENSQTRYSGPAEPPSTDQLPFAPASFLKTNRYYKQGLPLATGRPLRWGFILANRGCPGNCRFCSAIARQTIEKRFRPCSPGRVAEEMLRQAADANRTIISIEDDIFTADPEWTLETCALLRRSRITTPWTIQTRLDCVTDEIAAALSAAGCAAVTCGAESGSDKILAALNKNITADEIAFRASILKKHRIALRLTAMIGMPDETTEDFQKTERLVSRLNPLSIQIYYCTAYPDTAYGAGADSGGVYDRLESPAPLVHFIPPGQLRGLRLNFYLKYYFSARYLKAHGSGWLAYLAVNPAKGAGLIMSFLAFALRRRTEKSPAALAPPALKKAILEPGFGGKNTLP